jgi:hypothetical protein
MDIGRWEEAVTFETMGRGEYRVVASTAEAAHILVTQWPLRTGRAYRSAQKTFAAVLAGNQDALTARHAFLKAAEEAGVFIRP